MSLSPRSRLSRVTAADLVSETDAVFRSHEKFQKRSSSFASGAQRFKARQVQSPGPATYTLDGNGSARGAFLDTRSSRDTTKKAATDSMYNVNKEWKGKTSSTYGTAGFISNTPRGNTRYSDAPDPTRYQPDHSQTTLNTRETSASFRSRSPRLKSQPSYTPSPQAYAVSQPRVESRNNSAAFASTTPRLHNSESKGPPPGSHDMGSTFTKAAAGGSGTNSFRSRSPRMQVGGNDVPAPGAYEVTSSLSAKGGVVSQSQRSKVRATHSPGPNTYSVTPAAATTPASAAFRSSSARFKEDKPGGGSSYSVGGNSWGQSKGGSFTSTTPRLVSRYNDTPGPGTYTAQGAKTTRGGSMATSKRPAPRSYTPGPGTYTVGGIGDSKGRAATAAFRSTSARDAVEYKLGPGSHFVGSGLSSKGGRMSKAERFKMAPNDTPAPGHSIPFYSSFLD